MMLFTHIATALRQLAANKGKAALTMLGIVIGIGSVIFIMTVGEIAKTFLLSQLNQFGTNVMEIATSGGVISQNNEITLTMDDVAALEASPILPEIKQISGIYTLSKSMEYRGTTYNGTIFSTDAAGMRINNYVPIAGRLFNDGDLKNKSRVIVFTEGFAKTIFGSSTNAINKKIKVAGHSFTIIGVIADIPFGGGPFGSNMVYAPITTVHTLLSPAKDRGNLLVILMEFENGTNTEDFENRITHEMQRLKRVPYDQTDTFDIISRAQFLETFNTILLGIQLFISAVAGISLVVGGIGIMNIMLVTVKERTKEIGLRKAVGANNQSILTQFLVESVVLTTVGGIIGISLGLGLSELVVLILGVVQPTWNVHFIFVPSALILACGVSITIGILFGLYPAIKASRLHPIESLRYE